MQQSRSDCQQRVVTVSRIHSDSDLENTRLTRDRTSLFDTSVISSASHHHGLHTLTQG